MDSELAEYKKELLSLLERSISQFEKQISLISSGAFGVSFAMINLFFERTEKLLFKEAIFTSWVLIALCLLVNLSSHLIAFEYHSKTINEIDEEKYVYEAVNSRNKRIQIINWICLVLLALSFLLIIFFFFKNL